MTLVEVLMGLTVSALVLAVVYGVVHLLFGTRGDHSLVAMTERARSRVDLAVAVRELARRVGDSIEVLEPAPGASGDSLILLDRLARRVRIHRDASGRLVTEQLASGTWTPETALKVAAGDPEPVLIRGCTAVVFEVRSPACVRVRLACASGAHGEEVQVTLGVHNAFVM